MVPTRLHPKFQAAVYPDKPAAIMAASGRSVSYRQLDEGSSRGAQLLRSLGLRPGDHIAVMMHNDLLFYEVYWAAQRSGMYFTPISCHLTAAEAAYVIDDCDAAVIVVSAPMQAVAVQLVDLCPKVRHFLSVTGAIAGYARWETMAATMPSCAIPDEISGLSMYYSSGTTGKPKGIELPFAEQPIDVVPPTMQVFTQALGYDAETVYLMPAPLYHAAPLGFSAHMMRLGGTVVVMEKFDPEAFLHAIERYRVTHAQVVPTMFVRMLRLAQEVRSRYDLSTLRNVVHSAAPCPIPVKEQMIAWWGPCVHEYYSSSEGGGCTFISAPDWMAHKGSVGRSLLGEIKIVTESGDAAPTGEPGMVYFVTSRKFCYRNDPEKTREAFSPQGWVTLGDVGRLDDEGYLYLTDRKSYMIISGGVNIYPQEAENVLSMHPQVADVAVFGVPHPEFGEEVKAVVQPVDMDEAGPELAADLMEFCRGHLAGLKCPKSIDFDPELPRQENGKLYKRLIRDRYWTGHTSRVL
ncbi:acyl-CoA synthetase [Pseudorhodoferax sp. Leaf265]|nr:acyl-CoA synthetase [Pseudorhodoferax sp. Leaf265]KQP19331.1 acyl-CoA synthetase [Pseudorhodoferax sp. Leaf265]